MQPRRTLNRSPSINEYLGDVPRFVRQGRFRPERDLSAAFSVLIEPRQGHVQCHNLRHLLPWLFQPFLLCKVQLLAKPELNSGVSINGSPELCEQVRNQFDRIVDGMSASWVREPR